MYFNENCKIRGSAAGLICPKFPVLKTVFGLRACRLLVTLHASIRASRAWASYKLKTLESDISRFHIPGPNCVFRPILPRVPEAGNVKAAGFKNRVRDLSP